MELHNFDYERALLGAILMDNRILDEHPVTVGLFESILCRRAFEFVEKSIARGVPANILEIGMMMPDCAGEVARLTECGSPANARHYFDQLSDLAQRRGIARLARSIAAQAIDEGVAVTDMYAGIDRSLLEISASREVGYYPASHYGPGLLKDLEAAFASKGELSGVPSGFESLDEMTNGLQAQALIIIGARPGAGKTSIALNMSTAALRAGRSVGFFSAEMDAKSILRRMISDWGNVDHKRLRSGIMGRADMASIEDAFRKIIETRFYINDRPCIALGDLVAGARQMRRREGIGILFLDYLSLVTNERRDIPRHEQVAEISRTLKGLARELDIPVVVLSQLTREAQGERPKLSQLRDSGAVEQDADMVILLHALGFADANRTEVKINLIVEKNRNGATGEISMIFKPQVMRFGESDQTWYVAGKAK